MPNPEFLFVVSENGYGKLTDISEIKVSNRGMRGVRVMNLDEKTGVLVSAIAVNRNDEVIVQTLKGMTLRLNMDKVRILSRNTGVGGGRVIKLNEDDAVASVVVASSSVKSNFKDTKNVVADVVQTSLDEGKAGVAN